MNKICLLVGGNSIEHDCSIHMYLYLRDLLILDDSRFEVAELYYITPTKTVHKHRALTAAKLPNDEQSLRSGEVISPSLIPHSIKTSGLFVFSLLQGTEGEDGQYQGWAHAFDIPSNLGSVFSSSVSMHKWTQALIANTVLAGDVKPIDTRILSSSPSEITIAATVEHFSGRPCVLKPNSLGVSAFCCVIDVLTPSDLLDFAVKLAPYDNRFLVQERIFGREFNSGCLQRGDEIVPLPVMEFQIPSGFLSHAAKFSKGGYSYSFLQKSDPIATKLSKISIELFEFMEYDTACRFDFMLSAAGDLYFLEANSKPGLTIESHYILMLKEIGYTLLDLIEFAIKNDSRRFKHSADWRYKVELAFDV